MICQFCLSYQTKEVPATLISNEGGLACQLHTNWHKGWDNYDCRYVPLDSEEGKKRLAERIAQELRE